VFDKSIIMYGEVYLVVTDVLRTIKFIRKAKNGANVILASANDRFDDVEIPRDKILHLFIVKGKISLTHN